MLHERPDVDATAACAVPVTGNILEERGTRVVPVPAVVDVIGVHHPGAFGIEIADPALLAHRHVDVAEHRHQSVDACTVARLLCALDVAHHALVLLEHEGDVLLDQHVGVHQQETFGQQVEQLLHTHHVLVGGPVVHAAVLEAAAVPGQLALDVEHLSFGVVDDGHACHLLLEGPFVRIVKDHHLVAEAAMLAQAQDGRLGQFGRVVVDNCYCFHFIWVFGVRCLSSTGQDRPRGSLSGWASRGR